MRLTSGHHHILTSSYQDSHQQCLQTFLLSHPPPTQNQKTLNLDQAKCLASALVSSRLDYCNFLLHGIAVRDMLKLQRVLQGWSPGLVALHLASPFVTLHWLPISFRIQFKMLTLTYRTLSSGKPSYLVHLATPNRNLRLNKGLLLSAPKCKTETGTRARVVQRLCTFSLEKTSPVYSLF